MNVDRIGMTTVCTVFAIIILGALFYMVYCLYQAFSDGHGFWVVAIAVIVGVIWLYVYRIVGWIDSDGGSDER